MARGHAATGVSMLPKTGPSGAGGRCERRQAMTGLVLASIYLTVPPSDAASGY